MSKGYKSSGVLTEEELQSLPGVPSKKRASEGPVAVVECAEEFPCNPCEAACVHGAIKVGRPIINLPELDAEACLGCGECIPQCPGLAIFLMDLTYSEDEASISFPYEFLLVPRVGDEVKAVDRSGKVVTTGKVINVENRPSQDRTPVITISVPKRFGWEVRGIQRKTGKRDERRSWSDNLPLRRGD
jgi:Fe-S-cluster-containing hydrogenase component 2